MNADEFFALESYWLTESPYKEIIEAREKK
jgi:hypothetical protein